MYFFAPGMTRICLFGRQPIKSTKSFSQPQMPRKAPYYWVDTDGPFTTTQSPAHSHRATQLSWSWQVALRRSSLVRMAHVSQWLTDATEKETVWMKRTKPNAKLLFSLLDTIDSLSHHLQIMSQNMLFISLLTFRISLKSTKRMDSFDVRFFSLENGLIGKWPFKTSKGILQPIW